MSRQHRHPNRPAPQATRSLQSRRVTGPWGMPQLSGSEPGTLPSEVLGTAELADAVLLLAAVSAPVGLPSTGMHAQAPAGSMDRPAVPVAELDKRAWGALRWRQDRLPLGSAATG